MRVQPRYAAPRAHHNVSKRGITRLLSTVVLAVCGLIVLFYFLAFAELVALRGTDPPTTMVQVQRRVEAWIGHRPYNKRYEFVPLKDISPQLQHAVISAEDGRFFEHHGVDWKEVQQVIDQDMDTGRLGRGASTITQQLVKNLFLTTHRSIIRKGVELTLAPVMERIIPKQRILELYLNVIEWGPGVYGAEAAAHTWYGIPAARVNREQAARLAALIPSPLRRKPARMNWYSAEIVRRMSQRGW